MATAPAMQREAVALAVVAVLPVALMPRLPWLPLLGLMRLSAGNEGWQPVDVATAFGGHCALLRAGLMRLVLLVLLALRERLGVTRQVGLRLARAEGLFAPQSRLRAVVVAVLEGVVARPDRHFVLWTGQMGVGLAELLLRRRDQTIIMFGMLVVIFGRDGITGGLRIAGELHVFFRNVGGVPANFHIRTVRLVDTRHRIVTLAVLLVVAPAHSFVLTVSHDLPVRSPFVVAD
jgi:hypothetical protein